MLGMGDDHVQAAPVSASVAQFCLDAAAVLRSSCKRPVCAMMCCVFCWCMCARVCVVVVCVHVCMCVREFESPSCTVPF